MNNKSRYCNNGTVTNICNAARYTVLNDLPKGNANSAMYVASKENVKDKQVVYHV